MKNIYKDLPNHLNKIFDPRPTPKVKDTSMANLEPILNETFTITVIQTEKRNADGVQIQVRCT